MRRTDPIVAAATPRGKGAVGVVRLSGDDLGVFVQAILRRELAPRVATLCDFHGDNGEVLDRGLALWFPAGRSYTGEQLLELQGHGSVIVQDRLVRWCVAHGARIAEPGEFTQRAFLNDRLDLAQAEAVADLIDAQSELSAHYAMRSLQGEFSAEVHALVQSLIELRALVEASLDFPEEGLELVPSHQVLQRTADLVDRLERLSRNAHRGRRLRDGAKFVLIGSPNVGKSSVLNQLALEDVALVSDIPGTTRDVVKEQIVIEGLLFEVVDTAGLRESTDTLELMGMARTRNAAAQADLVIYVEDASVGQGEPNPLLPSADKYITVRNKIDLTGEAPSLIRDRERVTVSLSARTGEGLEHLRRAMLEAVGWSNAEEGVVLARARHLVALDEANACLSRARQVTHSRELQAEEFRLAQVALARITGEFTADDLLGEIFSTFCIGK